MYKVTITEKGKQLAELMVEKFDGVIESISEVVGVKVYIADLEHFKAEELRDFKEAVEDEYECVEDCINDMDDNDYVCHCVEEQDCDIAWRKTSGINVDTDDVFNPIKIEWKEV